MKLIIVSSLNVNYQNVLLLCVSIHWRTDHDIIWPVLSVFTSVSLSSTADIVSKHMPSFFWRPAPCGLRGCKNGPAPFPGRMSYKATKPGLVYVLYLSMFFIVLVFIRAPFYVLLVFIICVFCLLVVLVKLSLLAKLLARKTHLSSESSPLQFLALA